MRIRLASLFLPTLLACTFALGLPAALPAQEIVAAAPPAPAQEVAIRADAPQRRGAARQESAAWEANIYLDKVFQKGGIADQFIQVATGEDAQELQELIERYSGVVGLDPRTDIQRLHFSSNISMAQLEREGELAFLNSSVAIIDLKSLGNLEGLLIAAPGYKALDGPDGAKLHRIAAEGMEATVAFVQSNSSTHHVIIGANEELVRAALADAGSASSGARSENGQTMLADLHISRRGLEEILSHAVEGAGDEEYPASVMKRLAEKLNSAHLAIATSDDSLKVYLQLDTTDADSARQLEQLAKAGIAISALAAEDGADDPETQQILKIVQGLQLSVDGQSVKAVLTVKDLADVLRALEGV